MPSWIRTRGIEKLRRWRLLLILVAILAAARLSLAPLTEHYVNRLLSRHADYRGRLDHIDIDLWRGAYQIVGLELSKHSETGNQPFLSAESVDLSIQWSGILHGALVGEMVFHQPVMNFVQAKHAETSQTSIDPSWQKTATDLWPFRIDRIRILDGELHFQDLSRDPVVDLTMNEVQADIHNLTNIREAKGRELSEEELVATAEVTGRPLGQGTFWMVIQLDPFATLPTFDLDASLQDLDLVAMNDFLRAYANLDVERGTFHVFSEMAASQGRFSGYVKPLMENLKVVSSREVKDAGDILQAAWEKVAEGTAHLLQNKEHDQTGTRIPFEGTIDDPKADVLSTIGNLLVNAFVRALTPGLDHTIDLADAESKQTKSEKAKRLEDEKKVAKSKGDLGAADHH
jgi:hypothetical protein